MEFGHKHLNILVLQAASLSEHAHFVMKTSVKKVYRRENRGRTEYKNPKEWKKTSNNDTIDHVCRGR
ncbi:unnamed protein product [Sphenostylis stenocarpa]|uniref:Uncharacterized protein n=1 Tax=Sphenostylis stenocarpa TaxID=92480 RepID=A0AA86S531_9FABA|nr:unnamed protein product [Sphenostylis stenocarpa]